MSGQIIQSPGLAVVMRFYFVFWQVKPVVLIKIVELQTPILIHQSTRIYNSAM